ncbi:MAG TPA: glycosyltransferase family 1 protein, partial [Anaerolineales bacterium]|nr:glycosyltransferase family 1 protein [Anaerolineales bacterium]
AIVTVSESSKQDICKLLNVPSENVVALHNGYDKNQFNLTPVPARISESVLNKYNINKNYLLYFGGSDEHKNISRLAEAYSLVPENIRKKFPLVLAGSEIGTSPGVSALLASKHVCNDVILPGFIDDQDLPIVIKNATAFVYPSTHEGFGLPAVEAMACGVATIGSSTSSIGEIIANEEATFDPYEVRSITSKIVQVLTDHEARESIRRSAIDQTEKYSWAKSAKSLLSFMEEKHQRHAKTIGDIPKGLKDYIDSAKPFLKMESVSTVLNAARTINLSSLTSETPCIYLDLSSIIIHDHRSGIQRVARAISKCLLESELDCAVELIYTRPDKPGFRKASRLKKAFLPTSTEDKDTVVDFRPGDFLVFLDLHPSVAISHEQEIQELRALGVKVVHVVYDLLPLENPEAFWPELCNEFAEWIRVVGRSDGALCISDTVAKSVVRYLETHGDRRHDELKVDFFHLGADIGKSMPTTGLPDDAEQFLSHAQARNSFLMVGTLEPRKGHHQAIGAFEKLWEDGHDLPLIIVGREGWGVARTAEYIRQHPMLNEKLFWFDSASDEFLEQIYQSCMCLIAASEGEGFGLPLIEAAQQQIFIIARDIDVFREVAGEGAFYFKNSLSSLDMATDILSWISLADENKHPKSDGINWLKWRDSASKFLDLLFSEHWKYKVKSKGFIRAGFPIKANSKNVIWKNFSSIESDFRWSSRRSEVIFYSNVAFKKPFIYIQTHSWKKMDVKIFLNDALIFSGGISRKRTEIEASGGSILDGQNIMRIEAIEADSPSSGDGRCLGAAISIIRIDLPKILKSNTLESCRSGNVKWLGFSEVEDDKRWTVRSKSSLKFLYEDHTKNASFEIRCQSLGGQSVIMRLNGSVCFKGVIPASPTDVSVPLKSLIKGINEFILETPEGRSPGTEDTRTLGIAIYDIRINV